MFLFRFMSRREYELLITGHTLVNLRRHADNGMRTTSVGFCFGEISNTDYDGLAEVEVAYHHLSGLVCPEVCCVFEVKKDRDLHKAHGEYTTGIEDEWCSTRYSLKTLEPKFVCFNILPSGSSYSFQWCNDLAMPRCAHKMPENRINERNDTQYLQHLVLLLLSEGSTIEQAVTMVCGYKISGLWLPEPRVPRPDYEEWRVKTHCPAMF